MKSLITLFCSALLFFNSQSQSIKLIVRADDMGITHATNLACIDAYTKGIARSVEVMVPAPWFMEAVQLLNDHPGYDAGIHLVLNSEWTNLKWRPVTCAKSLTDSNGHFFPTPWTGSADFPSLHDNDPDFAEAEKELIAQVEMALQHIPRLSHISTHMAFDESHPELKRIVQKLSSRYRLPVLRSPQVENFPGNAKTSKDFIEQLDQLEAGKIYLLVTHPSYNTAEMQSIFTAGYTNVGSDRSAELSVLTSKKVRKALKMHKIELVSIRDYLNSIKIQ